MTVHREAIERIADRKKRETHRLLAIFNARRERKRARDREYRLRKKQIGASNDHP